MKDTKTSDVRFSVVIPTRERADTLKYTLKTCLAQDFENYEIVVSDNCSSSATKEVVDNFKSEKIKYFRSDRPLAMGDSWEFALSHAIGEYIILIGDDDGLLLNSLSKIDKLIKKLGTMSLSWKTIQYDWPGVPTPSVNKIRIPWGKEIQFVKANEAIQKRANLQQLVPRLPMLYHSAIHKNVIDALRKKTGRVFCGRVPDIYFGFAAAYLLQVYPVIESPMSISAVSPKSTGVSQLYLKDSTIARDFNLMNTKAGLGSHPHTPNVSVIAALIADSFFRAKDALFPNNPNLFIDRKRLIINCLRDLKPDNVEEWNKYLSIIRKSTDDDIYLQKWFDSKFFKNSSFPKKKNNPPNQIISNFLDYYPFQKIKNKFLDIAKEFSGFYTIDATVFGVKDVFGVAELYEKIQINNANKFELSKKGLRYTWRKFGNKLLPFGRFLLNRNLLGRINL